MDDTTPGGGPAGVPGMSAGSSGGPVAERMQALLSRAVEEQVSEQRQTSAVLGDLRVQMAAVADQLRGLASGDRVEQLASDLGSLTTELRRSTTGLGERLDAVARTLDGQVFAASEQAAAGSAGTEALAVRLGALGADVAAQSASLDRVGAAIGGLSSFPDALAALQGEIAGLHDRLSVLPDLRNGLADLTSRTGALEAMRPELTAVAEGVEQLATAADVRSGRDSVVVALGDRLERLEAAAERPVLSRQELDTALDGALADVRERVGEAAAGGAALQRLDGVEERFGALQQRLDDLVARLAEVGDAARGVPGVATDVAAVASRLDVLDPLREQVAALGASLATMQQDDAGPALAGAVTDLREDVADLGGRVDAIAVPSADAVALAVSGQVGDRIVDALAPRVADVVLTRVAAVLVEQVATTVTASVQNGLTEKVRAASAESERRMSAHVDEAILALAEALLRRRRPGRTAAGAAPPLADLPAEAPPIDLPAAEPAGRGADGGDGPRPAAEAATSVSGAAAAPPDAEQDQQVGDVTGPEADGDEPEPVVPAVAEVAGPRQPAPLDPTEEQAEAEFEGRAELADDAADDHVEDDEAPASHDRPGAVDVAEQADDPAADDPAADDLAGRKVTGAPAADAQDRDDGGPVEEQPTGEPAPAEVTLADEPEVDTDDTDVADEPEVGTDDTDDTDDTDETDDTDSEDTGSGGTLGLEAAHDSGAAAAGDDADTGESPSERTGAFALRSGLRGLGLHVEDPDLGQRRPTAPRPAPPARPRLLDPTPDLDDDDREPVRPAPRVQPRPEVQQRFASASNAFPAGDDEDDEDDDDSTRRRPWWRPGG